jgi:hypothetical protein
MKVHIIDKERLVAREVPCPPQPVTSLNPPVVETKHGWGSNFPIILQVKDSKPLSALGYSAVESPLR